MLSLIAAPENFPFAVALTIMLGIALLEGISTLFGAALSGIVDAMLPDAPEVHSPLGLDASVDAPDAEAPYALSRFFSWLRVGEVPVLMLLVIFLTAFGLLGISIQSLVSGAFNQMLPSWVASIPAVILSLPVVRVFGGVLTKIMPSDETEAISVKTLIGRIATITIGTATQGRPAEARVTDSYGTSHLLMVEPDQAGKSFSAGDQVLLVKKQGNVFKVISNTNSTLTD